MKRSKNTNSFFSARRMATLAVLTAMSLITFMIESLFPPLFIPGAKMGLSNIFSLLALFVLGPSEAIVLVLVRTTLGSVFTGNISTLMYSMTAGLVSVIVSTVLVEFAYPKVSIVAISVVAAVIHNLTQNTVFCLVSNTPEMFLYMPWLALLGVLAGVIVGFAVWFILRAVPTRVFLGATDFNDAEPQSTPSERADANEPQVANVDSKETEQPADVKANAEENETDK